MTPNEYQKLAMRTCKIPNNEKQKEEMIYHAVFGLASEAGEVAGIFQKKYQGHPVDKEHIKKEMGDCLWMIAELATALDIEYEDIMKTNIDKLKARFPEGFSEERSLHRAKEDI